jgi:hypothetical protein
LWRYHLRSPLRRSHTRNIGLWRLVSNFHNTNI